MFSTREVNENSYLWLMKSDVDKGTLHLWLQGRYPFLCFILDYKQMDNRTEYIYIFFILLS